MDLEDRKKIALDLLCTFETAKIISISPDAVQSERGTWYEIELKLEQQKFTSGSIDYTLVPGIQVEIYILTGERTILSYVTTPFHNSVGQALQER